MLRNDRDSFVDMRELMYYNCKKMGYIEGEGGVGCNMLNWQIS